MKVGFTKNPKQRAKSYYGTNPRFRGFSDVIEGSESLETYIHTHFFEASQDFDQINDTEWFICNNKSVLEQIISEKFKYIFAQIQKVTQTPIKVQNNMNQHQIEIRSYEQRYCLLKELLIKEIIDNRNLLDEKLKLEKRVNKLESINDDLNLDLINLQWELDDIVKPHNPYL